MSNFVRNVRHLERDLTESTDLLSCEIQADSNNPDNQIRARLRQPLRADSDRRLYLEIYSDRPVKNVRPPEVRENEVYTHVVVDDHDDNTIMNSQFFELEIEDSEDSNWKFSLNNKSEDEDGDVDHDSERKHKYVFQDG